jgi:hypothetical protein
LLGLESVNMADSLERDIDTHVLRLLDPDETIQARVQATAAAMAISQRRLVVIENERVRLDVPIQRLRRVQLDIERDRPATLVLVPEHAQDEPQVLSIPPEEYEAAARAIVVLGHGLVQSRPAPG